MELDDLSKELLDSKIYDKTENTESIKKRKSRNRNTI